MLNHGSPALPDDARHLAENRHLLESSYLGGGEVDEAAAELPDPNEET